MIEKKKKKVGRRHTAATSCLIRIAAQARSAKSYPDSRTDLVQDFAIFIRIKSVSGQNSKILSEVGAPTARPLDDFRGSW